MSPFLLNLPMTNIPTREDSRFDRGYGKRPLGLRNKTYFIGQFFRSNPVINQLTACSTIPLNTTYAILLLLSYELFHGSRSRIEKRISLTTNEIQNKIIILLILKFDSKSYLSFHVFFSNLQQKVNKREIMIPGYHFFSETICFLRILIQS